MKWAIFGVRMFVGVVFTGVAAMFFLGMPTGDPPADENAQKFIGALIASKYLAVVKMLELLGGILVLSGRLTPLGLVILVPVTVNIALWDIVLVKFAAPPGGIILLALEIFLLWGYRQYFAPFFQPNAKPAA